MQLYVAGYCLNSIKGNNFFCQEKEEREGCGCCKFPCGRDSEVGFVDYLGFDQLDVVVVVVVVGGGL